MSERFFVIVSPTYKIIGPNLFDFIKILIRSGAEKVYLLTGPIRITSAKSGNLIHIKLTNSLLIDERKNFLRKILTYLVAQLLILVNFIRFNREVDAVICYQSESASTLLLARLLKKNIIVYVAGSGYYSMFTRSIKERSLSVFMLFLECLMLKMAHKIVVISDSLLSIPYFARYKDKSIIAPTRIFDEEFFQRFNHKKDYRKRKRIIGYIGRLEGEKGVLNFASAIMHVSSKIKNIEVLVVGDGTLKDQVIERIGKAGLVKGAKITGWVKNPEDYLNEIKLLVLPSFTEGLPNVVLEAMASGTPVLATPVGAMPNIIKDGETGFLLRSNDPRHITERIVELLNKPELLEKVSKNAYEWVRENFSEEKTLESWRRILRELEAIK